MIDSMLFVCDLPAGTYVAGQEITMTCIRGPSVVRDGYGKAVMKRMIAMSSSSNFSNGTYVRLKNANWNDYVYTQLASANGNGVYNILAKTSPAIQRMGDVELQPNSSFEVTAVLGASKTTTADISFMCLIDIDYPAVQAIANPAEETGTPCTIVREDTITTTINGGAESMTWNSVNVDEFKAGYRYLLSQIGALVSTGTSYFGFVEFSGAPSMNGLVRIIPIVPKYSGAARMELNYSTALVKGPMNISYAVLDDSATSATIYLECDYIRR